MRKARILLVIICLMIAITGCNNDIKSEEEIITSETSGDLGDLPYNDYTMFYLEGANFELTDFPINEDFSNIKVYKELPIELTDEEKELIRQNLSDTVWEDIEFVKPDVDGLISLRSTREKGGIITRQENYQYSKEFIEKSGLLEVFKNRGIVFKIEEYSEDRPSTFYWAHNEFGNVSKGYFRLDFDKEKNLHQCKIYAVKGAEYKTLNIISVYDAMNNPFFAYYKDSEVLKQQDVLNIVGEKVVYLQLTPLYEFTVKINEKAEEIKIYTPCISNQELMDDKILYNQFLNFLTEGVLQ